ncbi:hypothetical protein CZ794_05615 [Psychrobacter sp. JB385]|nr:hypothetical protein CZ794_05615 [Psychrobacter sp. JB385]
MALLSKAALMATTTGVSLWFFIPNEAIFFIILDLIVE